MDDAALPVRQVAARDARHGRPAVRAGGDRASCVHDENGAVGIGIGHKRAGLALPRTCSSSSTSIPAKRPIARSITAGRSSRAAASSSTATIGAGRTRSRSSARRPSCAMTGTIDVLRAIAEGRGPSALADRARLCRLGRGPARRGNDPPRLVRRRRRARRSLFDTPTDERWDGALPGRGHRPAPAASARPARREPTYKEFFIFAFGGASRLGAARPFHHRRIPTWPTTAEP